MTGTRAAAPGPSASRAPHSRRPEGRPGAFATALRARIQRVNHTPQHAARARPPSPAVALSRTGSLRCRRPPVTAEKTSAGSFSARIVLPRCALGGQLGPLKAVQNGWLVAHPSGHSTVFYACFRSFKTQHANMAERAGVLFASIREWLVDVEAVTKTGVSASFPCALAVPVLCASAWFPPPTYA